MYSNSHKKNYPSHTARLMSSAQAQESKNEPRAKNWCVTIYEYGADELQQRIDSWPAGTVERYVYQQEECPSTGRRHLQCFFGFSDRKRRTQLQQLFGSANHFEAAKGTVQQNYVYCTKADSRLAGTQPVEYGTFGRGVGMGKRSDLDPIAEAIQDGQTPQDIARAYPVQFIKYHKGIQECFRLQASKRRESISVIVLYGASGTGKSFFVRKFAAKNGLKLFSKNLDGSNNPWFDGYVNQEVLLLDDFDDTQVQWHTLLRWLDEYDDVSIQFKGGFTQANWSYVFITTNKPLDQWYPNMVGREAREPLVRRIHHTLPCQQGIRATNVYSQYLDTANITKQPIWVYLGEQEEEKKE